MFLRVLSAFHLFASLRKNFLGDEQTIERRWKTCINSHLYDNLHDLLFSASNIEGTLNMHF